jgi:hypothetical protein
MVATFDNQAYALSIASFTSVAQEYCKKEAKQLLKEQKCAADSALAIYNHTIMGPYMYTDFGSYLVDVSEEVYKNSVAFHLFNFLTANKIIPVNSTSLYARAARSYCPSSFSKSDIRVF